MKTESLEQPEQEPVAFELYHHIVLSLAEAGCRLSEQQKMVLCNLKAVTTPPQRTWVDLTEEEIYAAMRKTRFPSTDITVSQSVIEAFKGKNT